MTDQEPAVENHNIVEMAPSPGSTGGVSAGSLCLDFVATLGDRARLASDLLESNKGLESWLQGAGLPLPAGGVVDDDLLLARGLRSAVSGVARSLVAGRHADAGDVRIINSCASNPTPISLLRPGGRGRSVVEESDMSPALSVIARDAIYLFADSDIARLRECARDGCSTLFYDRSPSGRRRWCAMKGCGEVVASAAYRRRKAEGR